jgi:hypothetical protein
MLPSSTDMSMFICASHIGYQPKIQPFRAEKMLPSSTANPAIGWCGEVSCICKIQQRDHCLQLQNDRRLLKERVPTNK